MTGKPAAKVSLGAQSGATPDVGTGAHGVTDDAGKVSLQLPPGTYNYLADPYDDVDVIRTQGKLTVAETPAQQAVRIKMNAGCPVQIEVVDALTGKGVPEVGVWYAEAGRRDMPTPVPQSTVRAGNEFTDTRGRFKGLLEPRPGKWVFMTVEPTTPLEYQQAQSEPVELIEGKPIKLRLELRKR